MSAEMFPANGAQPQPPCASDPNLHSQSMQSQTMPMEVVVLTHDYEIQGYVHVSRASREDRRITDLLNTKEKRFLAITNAQLIRRDQVTSPRSYAFIQVHVDSVMMVHPSAQSLLAQASTSQSANRYEELRRRLAEA
jgi:cytidylate kinase